MCTLHLILNSQLPHSLTKPPFKSDIFSDEVVTIARRSKGGIPTAPCRANPALVDKHCPFDQYH